MDDYSVNSLGESKNEWCARLINVLTPELIQGLKSIFDEAWKLCHSNDEEDKYLLVFQTFLSRVPKWNPNNIQDEVTRIIEKSGCNYLEELLTCVHVIHLKILTCVRVGQRQKKVDIDVPSLKDFIHKVYINIARKVYTNIYLFEKQIPPLQIQKNNRELELIIKECILNTVRESIPVDSILRAYMDETEEQDVEVKEVEEKIPVKIPVKAPLATQDPIVAEPVIVKQTLADAVATATQGDVVLATQGSATQGSATQGSATQGSAQESNTSDRISFSDVDNAIDTQGNRSETLVPKTEENLIAIQKKNEEFNRQNFSIDDEEDDDADEKLRIGGDVKLDFTDVNDMSPPLFINTLPPLLDDIVVLS